MIVNPDGFFDLRCIAGKIFIAKQPAVLLGKLRHLTRDIAFVKAITRSFQSFVPALAGILLFSFEQSLERAREIWIAKDVPSLRRLIVR